MTTYEVTAPHMLTEDGWYRMYLPRLLEDLPDDARAQLRRAAALVGHSESDLLAANTKAGLTAAAKEEGDPPPEFRRDGDWMEFRAAAAARPGGQEGGGGG